MEAICLWASLMKHADPDGGRHRYVAYVNNSVAKYDGDNYNTAGVEWRLCHLLASSSAPLS